MNPKIIITVLICSFTTIYQAQNVRDKSIVKIKRSQGFIFTNIFVNGEKVKALIDFGDPNVLQLSSTFVKKHPLDVKKTGSIAQNVNGNQYEVNQGTVKEVIIGEWKLNDVIFFSSPGEIEEVSQEIKNGFNAVVGWGYFGKYYNIVDYKSNKITLFKEAQQPSNIYAENVYQRFSSYITLPVTIKNIKANLILDAGSQYNVIDATFYNQNQIKDFVMTFGEKDIPLNVITQDLVVLQQLKAVGIIGGSFIEQFVMHINPFKEKIILEKR